MREKSGPELINKALSITFGSKSIFCIELLTDYLYLADLFKGDPYNYRINRPGTVNKDNWSMTMPLSLEEMIKNRKVCQGIKTMVSSSKRSA